MKNHQILSIKRRLINLISEWGFTYEGLKENKNGEWWLSAQLSIIIIQILMFLITITKTRFNNLPVSNLIISIAFILIVFLITMNAFIVISRSLLPVLEIKKGEENKPEIIHPYFRKDIDNTPTIIPNFSLLDGAR
tara:strand:+ start:13681 stop:14088 length:408 start_codon:yes stop_codon:yes gene_type:complete